ncbi:hypothetical protein GCAAIG_00680 [Candidatus Electronema halotolerans]
MQPKRLLVNPLKLLSIDFMLPSLTETVLIPSENKNKNGLKKSCLKKIINSLKDYYGLLERTLAN